MHPLYYIKLGDDLLFAVRSSSPEEDLEGASFAGGYETKLGITKTTIELALKECFASMFDERVFIYKQTQVLDKIAELLLQLDIVQ